jgi:stage III sporulation protein AA
VGDVCGTVTAIRDITSINLRIAREFFHCSDTLYTSLSVAELKSLLIIGKPLSAKTTVLRDFARNLSDSGYKVAVIDERSEIGSSGFDLGMNTDVLKSFPKKAGFITALRALSPDFIICDEITGNAEGVEKCLNSGVGLIMTAHCGSLEEALRSSSLSGIIRHTEHIALLGTGRNIGKLQGLWKRELKDEINFSSILPFCRDGNRLIPLSGA